MAVGVRNILLWQCNFVRPYFEWRRSQVSGSHFPKAHKIEDKCDTLISMETLRIFMNKKKMAKVEGNFVQCIVLCALLFHIMFCAPQVED